MLCCTISPWLNTVLHVGQTNKCDQEIDRQPKTAQTTNQLKWLKRMNQLFKWIVKAFEWHTRIYELMG